MIYKAIQNKKKGLIIKVTAVYEEKFDEPKLANALVRKSKEGNVFMINLRKRFKLFSITALILCSLLMPISVTNAGEPNRTLIMRIYSQQPYSNLCWATVSSMIISFFNRDKIDRKVEIAKRIYGETNFNQRGSAPQMRDSIKYYSKRSGTVTYPITLWELQSRINRTTPVAVCINYTDTAGHALCVYGYDEDIIKIIDPEFGRTTSYTYAYFRNNSRFTWTYSIIF